MSILAEISHSFDNCESPIWLLDDLTDAGFETTKIGKLHWFLSRVHPKWDHIREFALVEFVQSGMDGSNTVVSRTMEGSGVLGLREMRHVWWGDGGYTYFPNMWAINEATKLLAEWFDVGEDS